MTKEKNPYKESGVNTQRGDELVDWLQASGRSAVIQTGAGKVLEGIGGFAGLFSVEMNQFKKPILVASTDGIGTKLLLGLQLSRLDGLGQDLVAMCANDLYTVGAVPLFFLDYYATGELNPEQFKIVLTSIRAACSRCKMALLGGETAEMPGLYSRGHFDLAGFVVGIVDEERRLGPHRTRAGDSLVAFKSTGFHSNGYSLIRKWLASKPRPDLSEQLIAPTKLYHAIPELLDRQNSALRALAHITGGGISGNLPRVIDQGLHASIKFQDLPTPGWMREFIQSNDATLHDVEEVFNLGVGMIAVVDSSQLESFIKDAHELGLDPHMIGQLEAGDGAPTVNYV